MNRTKGIILALISSGSFGLIPFFSKPLLNEGFTPSTILLYRSLFAFGIIALLCLIRKDSLKIPVKTLGKFAVLGAFYALTSFGLIYSYKYIDTGIATTIHFLYPVMVAFFMFLFYKEKITKKVAISAILSLVGVGFLSWSNGGVIELKGLLAVLGTVVTYAIYITGFSNKELKKVSQGVSMFYVMFFGIVMFTGITLVSNEGFVPITSMNPILNLLGLALIPTVISGLALISAIRYAGSTVTSILGSFEPMVAMLVGVLYFHEHFGLNSLLGLILILVAVTMVVLGDTKAKTDEECQSEPIKVPIDDNNTFNERE